MEIVGWISIVIFEYIINGNFCMTYFYVNMYKNSVDVHTKIPLTFHCSGLRTTKIHCVAFRAVGCEGTLAKT